MSSSDDTSGFDLAGVFREARDAAPEPAAPELLPGPIGGYEIEQALGRGGMGVVYRARDPAGRAVALKTLLTSSPDLLERFQREGELAGRLRHAGIVTVHAAGVHEGVPYLVQDLVEGGRTCREELEARDRTGRLELLRDVARALAAAHAQGIAHRDVKPGNVLIDAEGKPRVADFGLAMARDLDRITQSGSLLGSPPFMAPEQVNGQASRVGPATDVWSLGVMLYEALTGRPPFLGESMANLFVQILTACPPAPRALDPSISPELEAVVHKALEPDLARRYPDAGQLADDLDAVLAGDPPPWAPTTPPPRWARLKRRWRHREPGLMRLLVVAALLGLVAVAGLSWAGVQGWRAHVARELQAEREQRLTGLLREALPWVIRKHDPLAPEAELPWPTPLRGRWGDSPRVSGLEVATRLLRAREALRGGGATAPEPVALAAGLDALADDPLLEAWTPDARSACRAGLATLAWRLRASVGVHEALPAEPEAKLGEALALLRWRSRGVAAVGSGAVTRARRLLNEAGQVPAAARLEGRIARLEAALDRKLTPVVRGFGRLPASSFRAAVEATQASDRELAAVVAGLFACRQLADGRAAVKRLVSAVQSVRSWDADRYRQLIAALREVERLLGAPRLAAHADVRRVLRPPIRALGRGSPDAAWRGLLGLVSVAHARGWVAPTEEDLRLWRDQLMDYLFRALDPQQPLPPLSVNRVLLRLGVLKAPDGVMRRYLRERAFAKALDAGRGHGDLYFLRATFREEASRRPEKAVLAQIVSDYAAALGAHLSPAQRSALRLPPAVPLASPLTPRWAPIAEARLFNAHGRLLVKEQLQFLPGVDPPGPIELLVVLKRICARYEAILSGGQRLPRYRAARFAYEHARFLRHLYWTRHQQKAPPAELRALLKDWRRASTRSVETMRVVLDDLLQQRPPQPDDVPAEASSVSNKLIHSIEDLAQSRYAGGSPGDAAALYERELEAYRKRGLSTANMRLWYLRSQLSMGQREKAERIAEELLEGMKAGTIKTEPGERAEIEAGVRQALGRKPEKAPQ